VDTKKGRQDTFSSAAMFVTGKSMAGEDRERSRAKVLKSHQSIKGRLVYEDAHHSVRLVATLAVPVGTRSGWMPAESQGHLKSIRQRCHLIPRPAQLQLGSIFVRERNTLASTIEKPVHQRALKAHLRPERRQVSHR
jgi:hypothetical protein